MIFCLFTIFGFIFFLGLSWFVFRSLDFKFKFFVLSSSLFLILLTYMSLLFYPVWAVSVMMLMIAAFLAYFLTRRYVQLNREVQVLTLKDPFTRAYEGVEEEKQEELVNRPKESLIEPMESPEINIYKEDEPLLPTDWTPNFKEVAVAIHQPELNDVNEITDLKMGTDESVNEDASFLIDRIDPFLPEEDYETSKDQEDEIASVEPRTLLFHQLEIESLTEEQRQENIAPSNVEHDAALLEGDKPEWFAEEQIPELQIEEKNPMLASEPESNNMIWGQFFSRLLEQLKLLKGRISPLEYEQYLHQYRSPNLPDKEYYILTSLLRDHFIERRKYSAVEQLLLDVRERYNEYPMLLNEIDEFLAFVKTKDLKNNWVG